MGINKVILVGNVGRDAELRTLQSGTHIATFSFATTDFRFKDEQGNPRTEWHNIVAWGKLAEFCERFAKKGRNLYIEGSIRTRSYEKDGQKKYFTEIHAREVEFVGPKPSESGGDYAPPPDPGMAPSNGFSDDANEPPF
jgi:single-strand DNA-binding protein